METTDIPMETQGSPWLKFFCSQHFSQMEKVVAKFTWL